MDERIPFLAQLSHRNLSQLAFLFMHYEFGVCRRVPRSSLHYAVSLRCSQSQSAAHSSVSCRTSQFVVESTSRPVHITPTMLPHPKSRAANGGSALNKPKRPVCALLSQCAKGAFPISAPTLGLGLLGVFLGLSVTVACRGNVARNGALPTQKADILEACDSSFLRKNCFAEIPLAPPVIMASGNIRVLMPSTHRSPVGARGTTFAIVDITPSDIVTVVESTCPEGGIARTMARLRRDTTGILCLSGGDVAYWGVLTPGSKVVEWLWHEHLLTPQGQKTSLIWREPYVAELGDKIAVLFALDNIVKGVGEPPWAVRLLPNAETSNPLCTSRFCGTDIDGLVGEGKQLHVIMSDRQGVNSRTYGDLSVDSNGRVSDGAFDQRKSLSAGYLERLCIAESSGGMVTVSLPVGSTIDAQVATIRLPNAYLPGGPDIYSTQSAFCPPHEHNDTIFPDVPHAERKWVRAVAGIRLLLVNVVPAITPDSGAPYFYPGSLRVYR